MADERTKAVIYDCHRRAIDIVLAYAEREVFHSRSGTNGIVQEDIVGVVAASFTHWDSRAGDPQLHDHVVVLNRAQSISDGKWRTLDSRGLFKATVALSELHQGVLSDLLTQELGWGWDGRARRHSDRLRFEVIGVSEALMAEFSQRAKAIEARKDALIAEFVNARGRHPTSTELLDLRRRATLETRPDKTYRSLAEMTVDWRRRAKPYVGDQPESWVATLAGCNDLPLLRSGDLADEILADVARVAASKVADTRATFSRANVAAEVHRQLHGVRFATPAERIAVAERTVEIALGQSLLVTPPVLHHTPVLFRRSDGTSKLRPKGHEVYTSHATLDAEARLLDAGRRTVGPAVSRATVAARTATAPPGQERGVVVGAGGGGRADRHLRPRPGRPGRPGRDRQEHHHGRATRHLGGRARPRLGHRSRPIRGSRRGSRRRTRDRHREYRQMAHRTPPPAHPTSRDHPTTSPNRRQRNVTIRSHLNCHTCPPRPAPSRSRALAAPARPTGHRRRSIPFRNLRSRRAGHRRGAMPGPRSFSSVTGRNSTAVDAGGMFRALVTDRDHVPELSEVRRFRSEWERQASLRLRTGDDTAIDAYLAHGRISDGPRDELLEGLYLGWRADIDAGKTSLMIAPDLGTVADTQRPGPSRPDRRRPGGRRRGARGRRGHRWSR